MSVKDEDKPEQDVAKLDVAEAAPIKHEHHAADNTHLLRHDQQQQQQQQQADTAQVRMAAAADAESDPLQNGHPEDLEARSELLEPMDSDSAAIEAAFSLAQSGYFSQLPEHQSAAGAPVSLHNIPAWAPASDRLAGPVAKGNLHKADPITKGNAPMGHGLTEGTSRQQQLQSDTSMANPRTAGLVAASMIKDEDMHQEPGPGFQTDDSPMGVEVDVMDPENAYVKVEKEPLMRHASGSSGSEGGQAAMLDLGMQHRQASPAAHAGPSDLGKCASFTDYPARLAHLAYQQKLCPCQVCCLQHCPHVIPPKLDHSAYAVSPGLQGSCKGKTSVLLSNLSVHCLQTL